MEERPMSEPSLHFHLTRDDGAWRVDAVRLDLEFTDGSPDLEGSAESA